MPEIFANSDISKNIQSAKVGDIIKFIRETEITDGTPFTLYWKGKKLDDPNMKLRNIVVNENGQKFKMMLHKIDFKNPIVVILNEEFNPLYAESHDLDLEEFNKPQTPVAN